MGKWTINSKEYKFIVESTDPNNVSEYNKVPVYFKGQWDNKVIGEYHDTEMKLVDNKIVFENIANQTIQVETQGEKIVQDEKQIEESEKETNEEIIKQDENNTQEENLNTTNEIK